MTVVVVGGGPVGVGLALDLGLRGVPCTVVERRTELSQIPKGQGLSQRTMEHAARWGVADALRAAREMPEGHAIGQVTVYRDLLGEFWSAPPARELVQPYYAERNERLPQYRTEQVLRARLADLSHVHLRLGCSATSVEQDDEGVRVTVEQDGALDVVEGNYVVGCDGGRRWCASRPTSSGPARTSASSSRWWSSARESCTPRSGASQTARPTGSCHPTCTATGCSSAGSTSGSPSSSTRPSPPAPRARRSTWPRCCTAPPASRSASRSTTSASGTCGCRSRRATGPAARPSPATRRTPTRPTAASG